MIAMSELKGWIAWPIFNLTRAVAIPALINWTEMWHNLT
jgi:hypothetical protein